MRLRNVWVGLLGFALATTVVACGGSQETSSKSAEPSSPAATPAGQKVDTATAGDVKGTVMLDGAAPANVAIKMNADPVCVTANKTPQFQETYEVGSDGKSLANAFVYVKDGLGNYVYDTPTEPATIDQRCRHHPHVFGMRVGQPLQRYQQRSHAVNIHALPGNQEFNTGQPIHVKTTPPSPREGDGALQGDVHGDECLCGVAITRNTR
jgi:hypothetical protein